MGAERRWTHAGTGGPEQRWGNSWGHAVGPLVDYTMSTNHLESIQ